MLYSVNCTKVNKSSVKSLLFFSLWFMAKTLLTVFFLLFISHIQYVFRATEQITLLIFRSTIWTTFLVTTANVYKRNNLRKLSTLKDDLKKNYFKTMTYYISWFTKSLKFKSNTKCLESEMHLPQIFEIKTLFLNF